MEVRNLLSPLLCAFHCIILILKLFFQIYILYAASHTPTPTIRSLYVVTVQLLRA